MRVFVCVITAALSGFIAAAASHAHESDLPAGPIRERHELMENIGDHAKAIGDAMKAGDHAKVAGPANAIAEASKKIVPLFPAGSEHAKSRARAEIWQSPEVFASEAKELEMSASALAKAANEGGDVGQAAKEMFASCKSCHTKFRVPED